MYVTYQNITAFYSIGYGYNKHDQLFIHNR